MLAFTKELKNYKLILIENNNLQPKEEGSKKIAKN